MSFEPLAFATHGSTHVSGFVLTRYAHDLMAALRYEYGWRFEPHNEVIWILSSLPLRPLPLSPCISKKRLLADDLASGYQVVACDVNGDGEPQTAYIGQVTHNLALCARQALNTSDYRFKIRQSAPLKILA
jgi:hypothetical protein